MFGSSARLMEAEITAMLIGFEQAALAAIRHLDSAKSMREERLGGVGHLDDVEEEEEEGSARHTTQEADQQQAFVTGIIVESVVNSAIKPKAWLEEETHDQGGRSPFRGLQAGARVGVGSTKQRP